MESILQNVMTSSIGLKPTHMVMTSTDSRVHCDFHIKDYIAFLSETIRRDRSTSKLKYVTNSLFEAIHAYGLLHEQSVSICDNILTCVTILLFQGDQAIDRIIQKQDLLVCQITGQEDLKTSFVTQVMDVANSFWLQNERSVSSLQATVDFLLKTCCVDVTLQFVADYVRLNASYLSVVFKKKTGINFKDYVTAYKMKSASQQLINLTTTRIYEISQGLGYADAMHFSRVFRKYYGMTPNEYRSSHMSGCKKIYRS